MELKETLLMPKTDFPMRGNLPVRELDIQEFWREKNLYNELLEKRKDAEPFILHDGPPYANGNLHMGHAFNKILKDFINRYNLMQGKKINYVTGWDTHGLPIEQAVTKSGVNRKEKSIAEFRTICKDFALVQVQQQLEQFDRLGIFTDWDKKYLTLMPEYEAEQLRVFGEMLNKGLIYKGFKTVYWSPSSESALAEAEVEYHDVKSPSMYVAFEMIDGKGVVSNDASIIIWTTTPWTIPANIAISLNSEFFYAEVLVEGKKYIVAKELLPKLQEKFGWDNMEIIKEFKGKELEFAKAKHPLYDRESLVLLGDHVTLEAGTGAVHTAPGYGEEDFEVGKKYQLDLLSITDEKGYYTSDAGKYAGLFYDDANKVVSEDLKAVGSLLKLEWIEHSYPHDWRTKKPIIYWVTNQWFASIDKIKEELLDAIHNKVNWRISWGETRLGNMIEARNDWCISRQRVWGVPIPIFYTEAGNPILDQTLVNHVAQLVEEHGSNIWFEKAATDLLPVGYTHIESPNGIFTKEEDIMDVWFDSGTSYAYTTKKYDLGYPVDLYFEGSDQYRGWFNSSLITGVATRGIAPYKSVLSAGFVLDGKGHKMSKSLGNIINPLKLTKQYGADIIRLWVASIDYTADVRISDEIMKQISESYRKIRNNFRFMLGNLAGFNPTSKVAYQELTEVDQYVMTKYQQYVNTVNKAYDDYNFLIVYRETLQFITNTLSSFYFDYAKDILYCDSQNSQRRVQVQSVIYEIATGLVTILAPILSHTSEEVWQELKTITQDIEHDSVFELLFYHSEEITKEQEILLQKWNKFMLLRDDVFRALEDARNSGKVGKSLDAQITINPKAEYGEIVEALSDSLQQLFIVSKVTIGTLAEAIEYETAAIFATTYEEPTCPRCWNRFDTTILNEAGLCSRCAAVVETFK